MRSTLTLNASFEPLCVVSWQRAIVLVLEGKAEVIEASPHPVRTEHLELAAPSVIRLRNYVHVPYQDRIPVSKHGVLARDRHRCAYCSKRANTVDHVIPTSRGGRNTWDNLVAACYKCNNKKDNKLLADMGWELKFTPGPPATHLWTVVDQDPAWEPWLTGTAVA